HADLFEMAAAYLYHLVRNHPFVDGNKRVGLVTALVFLELNGESVEANHDSLVEVTLAVAEGKRAKSALAEFFRKHCGE
ncbi:MAG TPA: type II toxin-antitoxin system death-on-curing family toxin, partial [Planctomycetota bacterium]|nr:type II toxin-antitoxin system death-on-curing family toxin [Planctomycetota bacterium]